MKVTVLILATPAAVDLRRKNVSMPIRKNSLTVVVDLQKAHEENTDNPNLLRPRHLQLPDNWQRYSKNHQVGDCIRDTKSKAKSVRRYNTSGSSICLFTSILYVDCTGRLWRRRRKETIGRGGRRRSFDIGGWRLVW